MKRNYTIAVLSAFIACAQAAPIAAMETPVTFLTKTEESEEDAIKLSQLPDGIYCLGFLSETDDKQVTESAATLVIDGTKITLTWDNPDKEEEGEDNKEVVTNLDGENTEFSIDEAVAVEAFENSWKDLSKVWSLKEGDWTISARQIQDALDKQAEKAKEADSDTEEGKEEALSDLQPMTEEEEITEVHPSFTLTKTTDVLTTIHYVNDKETVGSANPTGISLVSTMEVDPETSDKEFKDDKAVSVFQPEKLALADIEKSVPSGWKVLNGADHVFALDNLKDGAYEFDVPVVKEDQVLTTVTVYYQTEDGETVKSCDVQVPAELDTVPVETLKAQLPEGYSLVTENAIIIDGKTTVIVKKNDDLQTVVIEYVKDDKVVAEKTVELKKDAKSITKEEALTNLPEGYGLKDPKDTYEIKDGKILIPVCSAIRIVFKTEGDDGKVVLEAWLNVEDDAKKVSAKDVDALLPDNYALVSDDETFAIPEDDILTLDVYECKSVQVVFMDSDKKEVATAKVKVPLDQETVLRTTIKKVLPDGYSLSSNTKTAWKITDGKVEVEVKKTSSDDSGSSTTTKKPATGVQSGVTASLAAAGAAFGVLAMLARKKQREE